MFNATFFRYNDVYSGDYGLKIASFDNTTMVSTQYLSPSLNIVKAGTSNQFLYSGLNYEKPPTCDFTIISEHYINDDLQNKILTWLCPNGDFKDLKIYQNELSKYTYKCIIQIINIIYHCGKCIGYNIRATFDSNYQYMDPIIKKIESSSFTETNVVINSKCDIIDDYIYPTIEFKTIDETVNTLSIINQSDKNGTNEFEFINIQPNVKYVINNQLRTITSGRDDNFQNFNLNWLRIVPGENDICVKIKGELTITCPQYINLRF